MKSVTICSDLGSAGHSNVMYRRGGMPATLQDHKSDALSAVKRPSHVLVWDWRVECRGVKGVASGWTHMMRVMLSGRGGLQDVM